MIFLVFGEIQRGFPETPGKPLGTLLLYMDARPVCIIFTCVHNFIPVQESIAPNLRSCPAGTSQDKRSSF